MKLKLIISCLLGLFLTYTVSSNNLFVYEAEQSEMTEVANNQLVSPNVVAGKTYSLKHNLNITTLTNGVITYVLPHNIAVLQRSDTSTYFNEDVVEYHNTFELPSVVHIRSSALNFSSNGELYVVSKSTNQTVIGTSMVNIVFTTANVFVKSESRYTQVYVAGGEVTVLDNKSSRKKKTLTTGEYLVVTPQLALSPREAASGAKSNSFSTKDVEDEESQYHNVTFGHLSDVLKNTVFVNYNENIFGVKLHEN